MQFYAPHEIDTNFDSQDRRISITDEQIASAVSFEGYGPDYLKWPNHLWIEPGRVPDEDPGHNAYHIQQLALAMQDNGGWIGCPATLYPSGHCKEGNHRIRAAKYLAGQGIAILIPVEPG